MSQVVVEGHVRWPFEPDKCASGLLPDIDAHATSKGASDIPFKFTKHMRGLAVIISEALAAVKKKRLHCAIVVTKYLLVKRQAFNTFAPWQPILHFPPSWNAYCASHLAADVTHFVLHRHGWEDSYMHV